MKKKTVMRLFAVLMAAALATSSAPSTMFSFTEVVMADDPETPVAETVNVKHDTITVTGAWEGYSYAVYEQGSTTPITGWKAADTESTVSFSKTDGLEYSSSYYVYRCLTASISNASTAKAKIGDTSASCKTGLPSLEGAKITLKQSEFTYDGNAISPEIQSVTLNGKTLDSSDYVDTTTASDATTAGTEVTVTIKGNGTTYCADETATATAKIVAADLATAGYEILSCNDVTWPDISASDLTNLKVRKKAAEEGGSDTELTASGNYNVSCAISSTDKNKLTVTVTGTGNYTGTLTKDVAIQKGTAPSLDSSLTVSADDATTDVSITLKPSAVADADQGYSYQYALKASGDNADLTENDWKDSPTFTTLSDGTTALEAGTGYNAYIRIAATDYTDASTASIAFQVSTTAPSLNTLDATVSIPAGTTFTYNGTDQASNIAAAVIVSYTNSSGETVTIPATTGSESSTVTNYTIAVTNATDAGTATITVTGEDGYTGEITGTCQIAKATIASATISDGAEKNYDGTTDIDLSATFTFNSNEYTVTGVKGTLKYSGAAEAVSIASATAGSDLTIKDSSNNNVTSNFTISSYNCSGKTAKVNTNTLQIKLPEDTTGTSASEQSTVDIPYGQTINLGATNDLNKKMTYTLNGTAKYLFSVDSNGNLKCTDFDNASGDDTITIAFATSEITSNDDYVVSADETRTLTITVSTATPVITLNTLTDNAITLPTTTTEDALKTALVQSVTYVTNEATGETANLNVKDVTLTYTSADGNNTSIASYPSTISEGDKLIVTGVTYAADSTHFNSASANTNITVTFSDDVPVAQIDDASKETGTTATDNAAAQTAASSTATEAATETAAGATTEVAATTNSEGNQVTVTTTTETDSTGAVTGTTTTSVIENPAANTTAAVTVQKDASGTIQSADAAVSKTVSSGNKATLTGSVVKQLTEAAGTDDVKITFTVKDADGKTKFKVKADADDLTAGAKLKIYQLNTKTGEYTIVNAKTYTVNKNGSVTVSMTSNKTYELVTEKEAKAIVKEIKSTIKVKKSSATLKKDKTTSVKLSSKLNMKNVKSIQYSTSKKSVATVNSKGKITAKKAGSATIKAKVTLKDGSTKTVKMTVNVK